jgi:hypothetical protein
LKRTSLDFLNKRTTEQSCEDRRRSQLYAISKVNCNKSNGPQPPKGILRVSLWWGVVRPRYAWKREKCWSQLVPLLPLPTSGGEPSRFLSLICVSRWQERSSLRTCCLNASSAGQVNSKRITVTGQGRPKNNVGRSRCWTDYWWKNKSLLSRKSTRIFPVIRVV